MLKCLSKVMPVTAKLRHLRIAPRKVRLVADLIRGKTTGEAQAILRFTVKRAGLPIFKLLKSAISNARNNFQLDESGLYISKIIVDEGPKYKRWRARARGRAAAIQKKTSHVTIYLEGTAKKPKKIRKVKKDQAEPAKKAEEISKIEKSPKENKFSAGQAKFKPELKITKPKIGKRIMKIFRRKSF